MQTSDACLETDSTPPLPPLPPPEEVKLTNIESENNHTPDVEVLAAEDIEEHTPAVQTAPVPVQAAIIQPPSRKLNSEVAVTKIQTAFRGYLV